MAIMQATAGEAGVVAGAAGTAHVINAQGVTQPLKKGGAINAGDSVLTGRDGRADIRFTDGALLQLHPASQFRVDEYVYAAKGSKLPPDGTEKGLFSLLKGSFRTITGFLGKLRRSNYAVSTPTATIGIRGTEYFAQVDQGLSVKVWKGEIVLDNQAGSFSITEGQSAHVESINKAPVVRDASGAELGATNTRMSGRQSGSVQIKGNTRIEATTEGTRAIAIGQGNRAINEAGVIGGE
jgi:hypothetical protein